MKKQRIKVPALAVILITFGSLAGGANAALIISNFSLTTDTVSFVISGTLNGPAPPSVARALFFVNAVAADPGFVTPVIFESPLSNLWTGTQFLDAGFPLFTGFPSFSTGDYFGLFFASDLVVGEAINGSVSAVFAPGTFDPSEVSTINVVWGNDGFEFSGGTLQNAIAVPELSSSILLGIGTLGFATRRRRSI